MARSTGYPRRAKFLRRRFWAVSVRDNGESLRQFVETNPRAEIKATLKPQMETSRFITFTVYCVDVPLSVDDPRARIQ